MHRRCIIGCRRTRSPFDGFPRNTKLDAFLVLGHFHIAKGALRDLMFSPLGVRYHYITQGASKHEDSAGHAGITGIREGGVQWVCAVRPSLPSSMCQTSHIGDRF